MPSVIHPWQQQIGDSLAQVVGYAIVAAVTYASTWLANRRWRPHAIKTYRALHLELRDDIDINIVLDRLIQAGAIHAFLSRIHNGDTDIAMRKKTRTHERTANGFMPQLTDYRAIPLSRVTEEIALVLDTGVTWHCVPELPECTFKSLCIDGGAGNGTVARIAVKRGKEVIGFVGADFATQDRSKCSDGTIMLAAVEIERILARYH
jgi:hypothetical protein